MSLQLTYPYLLGRKRNDMRKLILTSFAAVLASGAFAATLWDNGPYTTDAGTTFNGLPINKCDTATVGDNAYIGTFRLADDFTIAANTTWTIDRINIYGYLLQTAQNLISNLSVGIYDGDPSAGGTLIGSIGFSNHLNTPVNQNIQWYQNRTGGTPNGDRPVYEFAATGAGGSSLGWTIANNTGSAKTYWLTWETDNTNGDPNAFTARRAKQYAAGNSKQFSYGTSAWTNNLNNSGGGADELWNIQGSVVPEPGTFVAIAAGLGVLFARRRRK